MISERKEEILLKINSIKNFLCWSEKGNKPLYNKCFELEEGLKEILE